VVSVYQWRVDGIEPAEVRSAPLAARRAYWQTVVALVMEVKDRELAAGLDRRGRPMRQISVKTALARHLDVNPVTGQHPYSPMGRAETTAPPLQSTGARSRTRTLLRGKVDGNGAVFWWDVDSHTGQDWGRILARHAHGFHQRFQGGIAYVPPRDVFGISHWGLAEVKKRAAEWWTNLGAGLARHAPPPTARKTASTVVGYHIEEYKPHHLDYRVRETKATDVAHPGDFTTGWRKVTRTATTPAPIPLATPQPKPAPKPKPKPKPAPKTKKPKTPPPIPAPVAPSASKLPTQFTVAPKTKAEAIQRAVEFAATHKVKIVSDGHAELAKGYSPAQLARIPAVYRGGEETIYLNERSAYWNDPAALVARNRQGPKPWWSSDNPHSVIIHEVGHALHHRALGTAYATDPALRRPSALTRTEKQLIIAEVGEYASTKPVELVAEVYNAMMAGRQFSKAIMDLYAKFGGPLP